jgi:aminopeptidase N
MTVDSVSAHYRHEAGRRLVISATDAEPGSRRQFTVKYHGKPSAGLRIGLNKYKERTFFGESWPHLARHWLPVVDHPYDKATSEFIVTAPARYQVVSNGLLREERDLGDGNRLTHWKQSVPIAPWLYTIGVAQFSAHHAGSVRGVPLETWVYHQDAALGPVKFEATSRQAIEFFSDRIGPYPYEKLANIEAPGLSGGAEHASAILYGEEVMDRQRPIASLVAHEIAHQWFGNSVTESDWDEVWLSEGFATYLSLLFTEHYEGRDAFVSDLKRAQQTVASAAEKTPGQPIVHRNLDDPGKVLNPFVYQKAAWVLHMLRGIVGTGKFWAGIRAYYARFRDGNATTSAFRQVMEEQHGQSLGWFFEQWLQRPGSPVVRGKWQYDSASSKLIVDLEQTQPGDVFRLPMEISVDGRLDKLDMTTKRQRFEIGQEKAPSIVKLDPNFWVLMESRGLTRNY